MPTLPTPTQTDAVAQNTTTGVVDYLKYVGTNLVGTSSKDYGLGSDFKIVANGNFNADAFPDLVAQSQSTGKLDFLYLNGSANLIGTFLTANPFPAVHGEGFFGNAAGQQGPALISQLANGQIDILAFGNGAGGNNEVLVATDLIPGTTGFPTVVGGGSQNMNFPAFANIAGASANSAIITQLADGRLDVIGVGGSISGGTVAVVQTLLLPQTIGAFPVVAVNPDFGSGGQTVANDVPGAGGTFGVQILTQQGSSVDVLYLDSGYTTPATEGSLYASLFLSTTQLSGFQFVDGDFVAQQLFPIS